MSETKTINVSIEIEKDDIEELASAHDKVKGREIMLGGIGNNVGYDPRTVQKGLYAPYDAKVTGDYTGLTPPFEFDEDAVGNQVRVNSQWTFRPAGSRQGRIVQFKRPIIFVKPDPCR